MRIMTTRKLCFYTPDRKQKFETQGNRIIETCPDWARNDDMFKAAVRMGILTCLMEMSTKEEVAIQEAAPANAHEAAAKAAELEVTVEEVAEPKEVAIEVAVEEAPKTKKKSKKK